MWLGFLGLQEVRWFSWQHQGVLCLSLPLTGAECCFQRLPDVMANGICAWDSLFSFIHSFIHLFSLLSFKGFLKIVVKFTWHQVYHFNHFKCTGQCKYIGSGVQPSLPFISRTFSSSQTETLSPSDKSSPSPTPVHWQPLLFSVSVDLTAPGTSCKWSRTVLVFLCLACFTEYNVLKVHPHCRMCQNLLPFYDPVIFHCMDRPQLVYPSSVAGHRGCSSSWLWWVMLLWASEDRCLWVLAFSSLGHIPRSGIAGSCSHSVFKLFFFLILEYRWFSM